MFLTALFIISLVYLSFMSIFNVFSCIKLLSTLKFPDTRGDYWECVNLEVGNKDFSGQNISDQEKISAWSNCFFSPWHVCFTNWTFFNIWWWPQYLTKRYWTGDCLGPILATSLALLWTQLGPKLPVREARNKASLTGGRGGLAQRSRSRLALDSRHSRDS